MPMEESLLFSQSFLSLRADVEIYPCKSGARGGGSGGQLPPLLPEMLSSSLSHPSPQPLFRWGRH